MNTLIKRLLLLLVFFMTSSSAYAVDFNFGVLYWNTNAQGSLSAPEFGGYKLKLEKESLRQQNNGFAYFALEHAVTGVPNVRLAYTQLENKGKGSLDYSGSTYNFNGSVDFSHVDLTAYYRAIDRRVAWDLGLNIRKFDGSLKTDFISSAIALDKTYVFLYSDLKLDVYANTPEIGAFTLGTLVQAGKSGKEQGLDIAVYFQYTSPKHVGLTWGYRFIDIEMKSDAKAGASTVKLKTDFKSQGPYIGLHFKY